MDESYVEILEDLKKEGVFGSSMIDKEGDPIASDLPEGTNDDTFSIMCATIMGAANTANSELNWISPEKVLVDSKEGKIIITSAGKKEILAVIVDQTVDLGPILERIDDTVQRLKKA